MKKVLFIAPHLSTGGMPQYLYTLIEKLNDIHEVYCVEYRFIAPVYVVQRNKVLDLLGDRFISCSSGHSLRDIIQEISPDVVHLQEIPEYFMEEDDANWLYREDRKYFIVETSHDSSFSVERKKWLPDHFALISEYQKNEFQKLNIPIDIVEYDIPNGVRVDRDAGLTSLGLDPTLKHVLNVGLFTPRKNQAEIIEYATRLKDYPIQFHFVGNTAPNFASYWEPLLKELPPNVKIWGERTDVEKFYSCMDLFLFTSRGHDGDKETSPLVIREAIGYSMPTLIYNLPVYLGMYDKYEMIDYLNENSIDYNIKQILDKLQLGKTVNTIQTLDGPKDFESMVFGNSMIDAITNYGEAAGMYWGTYIHGELTRGNLSIVPDDVFLDLGANIGISTRYAAELGAKTYSVEPDPSLVKILQTNCPSTTVLNKAVSNKTGDKLTLYHWPYNPVNVGPTYDVDTISLKDIMDSIGENIIDYLKIDIEGYEETVFDELPNSYFKRIRQMFIEHHNETTLTSLVNFLNDKNFDVTVEYGNGQNYIYATNKRFMYYNKDVATVKYDNTCNKIIYSLKTEVNDFTVSVRDRDSRAVIWSTSYNSVIPNGEYWIIPVPKSFIDFETDINIGGLVVDFYKEDYLICSKIINIKKTNPKPVIKIDNDTEPVFMNYNEFFIDRIYDKYLHGKTFDCIIDVGANTGMWIEYMWDKVPYKSRIYAIEPNERAFSVLKKTYGDSIQLLKKALVASDGPLTFYTDKDNSLVSSISNYGRPFNNEYVVDGISCKTLWNHIRPYTVNLMKIDIESGEYALIESMNKSDFDRIQSFLIEYHLFDDITFDNQVNRMISKLQENGYLISVERLNDTGGYIFASKSNDTSNNDNSTGFQSKIKAVQLLLNNSPQEQQNLSVRDIEYSMRTFDGIEYVPHYNDVYVDVPPSMRCRRPNDVSMVRLHSDALTPAHYGCYDSFKMAVLSEFDSDVDYLMVFEGDAMIPNKEEFYLALKSLESSLKYNEMPFYISFGGRHALDTGYLQSEELGEFNDHFIVTNKIIGCQCLAFNKPFRDKLKTNLRTLPWDALDIYLNTMCASQGITMLVSKKTLVTQYSGYSIIDDSVKVFKEFSI